MKKISYTILLAILPAFLAWVLGLIQLSEKIYYLDYVKNGTSLIKSDENLAKKIATLAKQGNHKEISYYYVNFKNNGKKNIGKTKIEFEIDIDEKSELITSVLEGPNNYSKNLIQKVKETNTLVSYELDYINVMPIEKHQFDTHFFFFGPPPKSIMPISANSGIEFRHKNDNPRETIITITIVTTVLMLYGVILFKLNKSYDKNAAKKKEAYSKALSEYLITNLKIHETQASPHLNNILEIRNSIYNPDSRLKIKLRNYLKKLLS